MSTPRQGPSRLPFLREASTKEYESKTASAGRVRCVLELGIECKDNALPYVLFGFRSPQPCGLGLVDGDVFYSKIRSTDDKVPNWLAPISLGDGRDPPSASVRSSHHQFNTANRFHQATAVEIQGKRQRLHVASRLRAALTGLGGFLLDTEDGWQNALKAFRSGMPYDPTLWVTFLLLVHSGQHYRYTWPGNLEEARHTTLFASLHSPARSMSYAVDFIAHDGLVPALRRVEATFTVVSKHLVRYLTRSPKPMPSGP